MNKKVMAVAVAGVLAAPTAYAQTSNVQLYGRANLGVDYYKADGARDQTFTVPQSARLNPDGTITVTPQTTVTVPGSQINMAGRVRIFDNGSRVGLRGTEDLGNGLKAIFQIETGVNMDTGSQAGQAGTPNGSTGFWASRDSFVGVDSNLGRLTFGRQSVWWANGVNAQFAANYINTEIPWTNGTNLSGRIVGPVARYSNVVQYTTPTFAGINATLSYAPNGEAVQHSTSADTDGRLWGATLRGNWGPFYAQYDYASNKGNTPIFGTASPAPANTRVVDVSGHKLGASWGYMPGARVGLIWTRSYNENVAQIGAVTGLTGGREYYQDGWTLNWEHTFGNFQVMAQYGQTGDIKRCDGSETISCGNSKARGYMIGGRYLLSKRTWLYASYNLLSNKENSFADYTGGNISSTGYSLAPGGTGVLNTTTRVPFGADPEIFAVGIFHQF